MPRIRDVLERFRPAGAPGKATVAGVPADPHETADAELDPVFAALAATVLEAAELRRAGADVAARCEADAAARAHALVADARIGAEAERARAAAAVRERAAAVAHESTVRAEAEAARVHELAGQRRLELVGRVLERVRADLRALTTPTTKGRATPR